MTLSAALTRRFMSSRVDISGFLSGRSPRKNSHLPYPNGSKREQGKRRQAPLGHKRPRAAGEKQETPKRSAVRTSSTNKKTTLEQTRQQGKQQAGGDSTQKNDRFRGHITMEL